MRPLSQKASRPTATSIAALQPIANSLAKVSQSFTVSFAVPASIMEARFAVVLARAYVRPELGPLGLAVSSKAQRGPPKLI